MATENDKVNTGALATLVAVGTAAMIGICLAVNALVRHEVGSLGAVRDEVGSDAYRALEREQLEKLAAPAAWSDRAKGTVSIPIERAMSLVLTDLKRSPWNATPAAPPDAGAETPQEAADAGADAAATDGADAGAPPAPEPPAPAPLSPSAPPSAATPTGSAPAPKPSAAPLPAGSIQPVPRPISTIPSRPPAPPTPPPTQPPATP
jgi:hypothetical protein